MNLRSHKIRLITCTRHTNYFLRCSGIARYSFNWSLTKSDAYYREHGKTISDYDLRKAWNAHRKAELSWTYEVTKWASDSGNLNFCSARTNWFRDLKKPSKQRHFRKPRLKSKHRSKKSFTLYEVTAAGRVLNVPKLGPVKMTETVRFPGKIKSITISEQGGHWFASFLVDLSETYVYSHHCETQAAVGIDVGLNTHVAFSTGERVTNPKIYRRFERKMKKLQRSLSRKKDGSKNRAKAKTALAKLHVRIGDVRTDHLHQMTTRIIEQFKYIGMEDLNVAGMVKNHSLARALADASFGEIRRQVEYKAKWAGCHVAFADRFFASSKLCSVCDYKNEELKLSDRTWTCPKCGAAHDRDVNAARNLERVARGLRDTSNACLTGSSETKMISVADVRLEELRVQRANGAEAGMSEQPLTEGL